MKAKACEVPLRRRTSRIILIAPVAVVLLLTSVAAGIAQVIGRFP